MTFRLFLLTAALVLGPAAVAQAAWVPPQTIDGPNNLVVEADSFRHHRTVANRPPTSNATSSTSAPASAPSASPTSRSSTALPTSGQSSPTPLVT